MSAVYSLSSIPHNGEQGTFMDRVIQITKNVRMETVKAEAERIEREIELMRRGGLDGEYVTTRETSNDKKACRKSNGRAKKEDVKLCGGDVSNNANSGNAGHHYI